MLKDWHMHYTGSLPRDFILTNLLQQNPDYPYKSLSEFNHFIDSRFGNNYQDNKKAFDEIYSLFQSATKPKSDAEILSTYETGAYEIAKTAAANGLSDWIIISGPYTDIHRTHDRYLGMIKGFDKAGFGLGKITITFIRDNTGKIKNYSQSLLDDIFEMLKEKPFLKRIVGFDISGYEYPDKGIFQENIEILNQIIERKRQYGLNIDVGLHAGETLTGTSADELYDDYFKELAGLNIQRIGHGTYLWLNNKTDLLKLFAGKCVFDICPASNRLLTPVGDKFDGILQQMKSHKIKFTLNRDDPSIFGNWYQR